MPLCSKRIKSLSREYTYREDEMTDEYACGDVARIRHRCWDVCCDSRVASDEFGRPANRSRMAASLIEPIKSMKQSAVEAATAIANEGL